MIIEKIEHLFETNGYNKIPSNLEEYTFFWREENQGVTVILVIDYREGLYIFQDQHAHVKRKIEGFFEEKGEHSVHMLSLIVSSDMGKAKALCIEDPFCWIIDKNSGRLVVYESQVVDFYGWRSVLEEFLVSLAAHNGYEEEKPADQGESFREKWDKNKIRGLPWVNICLVTVNVIVFLICTFTGDMLYNKGALGVQAVIEDGSYYRMITSMFLHWDVQHLFSNMIVLYYVGEMVEKRIGHIPYAMLYFLSGIAGGVFSMGYELMMRDYFYSAGASGAVFGVEGALFLLAAANRGRQGYMTVGRVAFAVMFSLYCGFTSTGVNNAAHVGGVFMGFAVMAVIMMLCPRARAGKDRRANEG